MNATEHWNGQSAVVLCFLPKSITCGSLQFRCATPPPSALLRSQTRPCRQIAIDLTLFAKRKRNLFGPCFATTLFRVSSALLRSDVVRTSDSVTSTLICSRGTTSQIGTDRDLLAAAFVHSNNFFHLTALSCRAIWRNSNSSTDHGYRNAIWGLHFRPD